MARTIEYGIIFRQQDYASIWLRLAILIIDLIVLILFSFVLACSPLSESGCFTAFLVFFYAYMIEMKRRCGSLGNLATGTRLIHASGAQPSILQMITRSGFILMGWLFFIVDIMWITDDPTRQMVRDKFSGIYVIKRNAQSTGKAEIHYNTYMLLGCAFILKDMKLPKA